MLVIWGILTFMCVIYSTMVILFYVGVRRVNKKGETSNNIPIRISVVVPMRNEQENIDTLLKSLQEQNYPKEMFEIILVNDHSTDNTWEKAKEWLDIIPNLNLANLPPNKTSKKQAVAFGVEKAKYSHIVFTDADCLHNTRWLLSISAAYQQKDLALLIGPVMLWPTTSFFAKMQALEHASLTASTLGSCEMGFPIMASSANLSFNKDLIAFDYQMLNPLQKSGDDVFLLHNAKRKGSLRILCTSSTYALVKTHPAKSFSQFLSQRSRWASKATSYKDYATIATGFVVLTFNLTLVVTLTLLFFTSQALPLLIVGFGAKLTVDFLLLHSYLKHFGETNLLKVFIPLQIVYPFYVLFAFVLSVCGKTSWKQRN